FPWLFRITFLKSRKDDRYFNYVFVYFRCCFYFNCFVWYIQNARFLCAFVGHYQSGYFGNWLYSDSCFASFFRLFGYNQSLRNYSFPYADFPGCGFSYWKSGLHNWHQTLEIFYYGRVERRSRERKGEGKRK